MADTEIPDSDGKEQSDGVSQLVLQLPQAKNASEVFRLFASKVQGLFAGLLHISILLLPREPAATPPTSATTNNNPKGTKHVNGKNGQTPAAQPSGTNTACPTNSTSSATLNNGKVKGRTGQQKQPVADAKSWDFQEKLVSRRTGQAMDWNNCCVFHINKARGPIVQQPPSWPLSCTATFHAAAVAEDLVCSADYLKQGPHFLDWKALHEKGANSMVAMPMFSCNQPIAVLCLASSEPNAFANVELVRMLASVLSPYVPLLEYTTRRMEMQRLVNEIIMPIAAQLAQQKSQLARLGCSIEEDTSSAAATAAAAAAGGEDRPRNGAPTVQCSISSSAASKGCSGPDCCSAADKGSLRSSVSSTVDSGRLSSGDCCMSGACSGCGAPAKGADAASTGGGGLQRALAGLKPGGKNSSKRAEPVISKHQAFDLDTAGLPSEAADLDWGDFFFNLVSMCIVYVYFSKAAVAGESVVAILLCMGVAAFDIVLLVMRWLWFEHYINYGSVVLHLFQVYRVVVLPMANTWMSWSLLNKMELNPGGGVVLLLGAVMLAFILIGVQVRFFLHAPLQLVSVLFAATSTSDICGRLLDGTSGLRCIAVISALQLSLGLLLPAALVHFLEARGGRCFLPHMQAKRWLLHP